MVPTEPKQGLFDSAIRFDNLRLLRDLNGISFIGEIDLMNDSCCFSKYINYKHGSAACIDMILKYMKREFCKLRNQDFQKTIFRAVVSESP